MVAVICGVPYVWVCYVFCRVWSSRCSGCGVIGGAISRGRPWGGPPIEIVSGDGRIKFTRVDLTIGRVSGFATYSSAQSQAHTINRHLWNYPSVLGLGVVRRFDPAILLPYWFLSASCFAIGIVLTRRWSARFSFARC